MNKKKRNGWLKHLDFLILDLLCIQLAYLFAYQIRHPSSFVYMGMSLYAHIAFILVLADLCYVIMYPVYKNIIKRSIFREARSVIAHNAILWFVVIAYLFLTQQAIHFSRATMLLAVVFSVIFMFLGRVIWKDVIRSVVQKGKHQANVLLVSNRTGAARMIQRFKSRMYNGFNLSGLVLSDGADVGEIIEGIAVVCPADELLSFVKGNAIDEVMISIPDNTQANRALAHSLVDMGVVVHLAVDDMEEDEFPNVELERMGGYTFLTASVNTMGSAAFVAKRCIDIAAGLVGCAITGILFLFVAPLIYKASPGPIFYSQERVGKNGRRFRLYKFRSMYPDAEERKKELLKKNEMLGYLFKFKNAHRIICSERGPGKDIGHFIRRTSIDEFPQFYNILRGDMSLVGTRPPLVSEFNKYDLHHKIRLSVKPGLTGLWQVSGRSAITDFEEIVRLDAEYIERWSLRLDFQIILKTFKVVLLRQGAE